MRDFYDPHGGTLYKRTSTRLVFPPGWREPALNVADVFMRRYRRAPDANDTIVLNKYINGAYRDIQDGSKQADYILNKSLAAYYIKHRKQAPPGEVNRLRNEAEGAKRHYVKAHSKSFWDDVGGAFDDVGKGLSHIPGVGPVVKASFDLAIGGPMHLTTDIASGKRIDKALTGHLKQTIAATKTIAPVAQSIVSMVPGIGTGVSAAIAAGLAIASGKRIDQVMLDAVKGAIPGGPIAQIAVSLGHSALTGQRIDHALLDALPIPDQAKGAVKAGLALSRAVASGGKVDKALFQAAYEALPESARGNVDAALRAGGSAVDMVVKESTHLIGDKAIRNALSTGMALGHAATLQSHGHGEHTQITPHGLAFAVRVGTNPASSLDVAHKLIQGLDSSDSVRKAAAMKTMVATRHAARLGDENAKRGLSTLLATRALHDMHRHTGTVGPLHVKPLPLDPTKAHEGIIVTLRGQQIKGKHRMVGKGTPGANEAAILVLRSGMTTRGNFLTVA